MRKKCVLIMLHVFAFSFYALTQNTERISRLKDSLQMPLSDTQKIELLNLICFNYKGSNPDSGIAYGIKGLQLAEQLKLNDKEAKLNSSIGRCYSKKGSNTEALQYFNAALAYYQSMHDEYFMSSLYFQIGWIYYTQKRNDQALSYFLKCLDAAETSNREDNLLDAWFALATYYGSVDDHTEAINYYNKVLQADIKNKNDREIATDYINISNEYSGLKNYEKALKLYPLALQYINQANNTDLLGYLYEDWGDTYDKAEDYNAAINKYQLAQFYYNKSHNDYGVAETALALGDMMNVSKNYRAAILYLNKAVNISKQTNNTDVLPRAYESLSTAYSALGDYENAFNSYKLRSAIHDTVFTKEKEETIVQLQTQFETAQKEKENQLLIAKNDLVTANLNRNNAWLITAGIILVLLGILLFVVYRNRLIKIKNIAALKKQGNEILQLNNVLEIRALRAQMDPHFIFNCMASLQSLIWENKNEEADSYLSKFSRLLRMVLENSENNTVSLDKELDMLKRYLELESIRLKEKFFYKIDVDEDVFTEAIEVPTLIIQPFAENALWHGLMNKEDNRQLTIEIKTQDDMLVCIVEDNGIGRQKAQQQKKALKQHISKGMKIIEERLRIMRAQTNNNETGVEIIDLFTESQMPCGTKVLIRIPIKQTA
jgi:tetratricopeptide (TPR) repeat protein